MTTLPQKLDFTFRIIVMILTMTIGMMFLFFGARAAMAANLKTTATIYNDMFTVGDIFSGLPRETAEKVLGPAPQPGQDLVLNARTLMRIALALDLPWQPVSSADQIILRRAATQISTGTITDMVTEALRDKGAAGAFEVVFQNILQPEITLPHDKPATAEITAIEFDPESDRFTATLAAPSAKEALTELAVAGKIERVIDVPVLKDTMSAGDIINANDIEWIAMKERDLQHDVIMKAEDLAGMTPRRLMIGGKPVRDIELERPQLVGRGEKVTITYSSGPMVLTTQGKAMQNGAKGDMIRVVNLASNRTIDAFVEDSMVVTVTP